VLLLQELGERAYALRIANVQLRELDLRKSPVGPQGARREQRRVALQGGDGVAPARGVARGEVDEERAGVERGLWVLEGELPDDCFARRVSGGTREGKGGADRSRCLC
jgi:hypothetical protein